MSLALLLLAVAGIAIVVAFTALAVRDRHEVQTSTLTHGEAPSQPPAPASLATIWGAALTATDRDGQEGTLELRSSGVTFLPIGHHDDARVPVPLVVIERAALQGISVAATPCVPEAPAMQRPGCIVIHTTTGDHRFTVDQPEIKAAEFSRLYAVPRHLA